MATVTVQASGSVQSVTYTTSDALALAQTIANAINAGYPATLVTSTAYTVAGSSNSPSAATLGIVVNPLPAGAVTVFGAGSVVGGTESVVAGSGGTYFSTPSNIIGSFAGGNNTIIAGSGTSDTIVSGAGNDSVFLAGSGAVDVGAGANTVVASGATDSVLGYGTGDIIFASSGKATVSEFGNAALISATGVDQVNDGGTNDTVVAVGTAATVFGGSGGTYFLGSGAYAFISSTSTTPGATGSDTITSVGSGSETVFGGSSDLIFAGSSSLEFIVNGGAALVNGGIGADTIYTNSGSQVTYLGAAGASTGPTADLLAGAGSSTINAFNSAAGVNFVATTGNDTLIGGSGNDTFFAGSGSIQATGGAGSNDYAFSNGLAGNTVITDFKPGDLIVLNNYASGAVGAALASVTTSGGFTTMTLLDNTKITFVGTPTLNTSNVII